MFLDNRGRTRLQSVSGIIQMSFEIYGKGFLFFWLPFLFLSVPTGLVQGFYQLGVQNDIYEELRLGNGFLDNILERAIESGDTFIVLFTIILGTGVIANSAKEYSNNPNQPPNINYSIKMNFVIISFFYAGIVTIGIVFFSLLGIFAWVWLSVAIICITINRTSILEGFNRSIDLVRHNAWFTFRVLFSVYFIAGLISAFLSGIVFALLSTPNNPEDHKNTVLILNVVYEVVKSLTWPITGISIVLLHSALYERLGSPYLIYTPQKHDIRVSEDISRPPSFEKERWTSKDSAQDAFICNKCNNRNEDPNSDFCTFCGVPRNEISANKNYCPSCGADLLSDDQFCDQCGFRLK